MWVLYEKNTGKIVKIFHVKNKAKDYLNSHYWRGADKNQYALNNVNPTKLEEWKVWKLLSIK